MAVRKINVLAPEVLPDRPMLKAQSYASTGEAYSLDSVGVKFATTKNKKHGYVAPTGESDVAETLRRYVLIRSRYDLPDQEKYATRWKLPETSIEAANRIVSNARYFHAFGEDPSIGTTEVTILARVLSEGNPPKTAIQAALCYAGTKAYKDLMDNITDSEIVSRMEAVEDNLLDVLYYGRMLPRLAMHNSPHATYRRSSVKQWKTFCEFINELGDQLQRENQERRSERDSQPKQGDTPVKAYPHQNDLVGDWEQLVVSKPELSINHTGKLGRRIIAADSGREPRYINRIVTDPEKRIFSRKTRALGGVVLIDASGSMSLSENDLDRLLKASCGATVAMYSGGHDHPSHPNLWVIARKGRMCRKLPDPPGDNAVDGPALVYAAGLRDRASQPLIWVSDGHVTGRRSSGSNHNLRKDIEYIMRKFRVIQVSNVDEAERLMKRLQGGSR